MRQFRCQSEVGCELISITFVSGIAMYRIAQTACRVSLETAWKKVLSIVNGGPGNHKLRVFIWRRGRPGQVTAHACDGRHLPDVCLWETIFMRIIGGCMSWLENRFEKSFLVTTVDYVFNWARKSALWPMTFGLACCAIEMIASSTARFDIARFGSEVFRPSPRQSDLMIVSGTVSLKMAPVVKRIYDQMPDPKWVIAMGACASVGGPFNTYSVLQGVDRIIPVDVYALGCPPRPENLFYALLKLQDKIDTMSIAKKPTEVRLQEHMMEEFKKHVTTAQSVQTR